ncbi:aldo/keto reductase [Christensenellaceae bacterium OttesenSCG-928-L17]|nr:aldo/keto reductase [Christensenellaceae bacterium OttesenSCG-928-L17]
MEYRLLGNTGINVSRLCFGTLTMGPLQKNLPLKQGTGLFELAFELGVNFIDTAEIYGTYPYVKEALRIKPDAVVCTKSYSYDEETARSSFETAVEGIGREYIDLFLLHEQESEHTIRGHWEAIEYFLKKKEQGYIGAIGLSTHHVAGVLGANKYPELDVVFPLINKTGIGIADGTMEDMLLAIEQSAQRGKGLFAMKPLGGGHLREQKEEALDFLLQNPMFQSIALGMQSEAEVRYNCAYFSGERIDEAWTQMIDTHERRLLIHDWCEGCGACVARCKSGALQLCEGRAQVDNTRCVLCGYCAPACPQFCIKVV